MIADTLGRFRLQPRRLTVPAVLPEGRTIARRKERVGNRLQMLFGWQAWIKNLPELHHNLFARRHLTAGREQDQADYPVGLVRRCGSRYTIAEVLTEHKGPIDFEFVGDCPDICRGLCSVTPFSGPVLPPIPRGLIMTTL